jgi:dTDP-glucose 4,6-dehydratase
MKICILGGGGCFGLNLARHAIVYGHEVFGIGRSPVKPEWFWLDADRMGYRYFNYSLGPDTEFIMDLLDKEKPELIVNFAAQGEGAASFKPAKHWKHFFRTNGEALVDLVAQLSEREWMRKFIQIGTSELYGPCDKAMPEDAPLVPTSPYAASKAAFDLHLQAIHKVLGFPMNIIRPSNCYTPGQQLHRIIPKALLCAVTKQKLPLHGGGRAEKSYLHATDLSRAILLVSERGQMGEVYNVGPDEPTSIREVVEKCAEAAGVLSRSFVEMADDRTGQDSRYWLDSSKVKALGWKQEIDWTTGLFDMYRWVNTWREELSGLPSDFRMRA